MTTTLRRQEKVLATNAYTLNVSARARIMTSGIDYSPIYAQLLMLVVCLIYW